MANQRLQRYEYVWRLDADSYLLGAPASDPFADMARANATYGWIHAYRDDPLFVTGLWETTRAFLRSRRLSEQSARCCASCARSRARSARRRCGRATRKVPGGRR